MPIIIQVLLFFQLASFGTFNSVCNGQNAWTFYSCGNSGVIYITTNAGGNFVGLQNMSEVADKYSLSQNYPNPFNPVTKIRFETPLNPPEGGKHVVRLLIYDILGKEIERFEYANLKSGSYEIEFDGKNLASGVYFYSLTTGNFTEAKKMLMIK